MHDEMGINGGVNEFVLYTLETIIVFTPISLPMHRKLAAAGPSSTNDVFKSRKYLLTWLAVVLYGRGPSPLGLIKD